MDAFTLQALSSTSELVAAAHESDEPIVVLDGDDECLVAMRPTVFERILFDGDLLNVHNRDTLHF